MAGDDDDDEKEDEDEDEDDDTDADDDDNWRPRRRGALTALARDLALVSARDRAKSPRCLTFFIALWTDGIEATVLKWEERTGRDRGARCAAVRCVCVWGVPGRSSRVRK